MAAFNTTLVAGSSTESWQASGNGLFTLVLGGTFNTTTATLEVSLSETGFFRPFYADDPSGTPALQAFTASHVPSATDMYARLYVAPGLWFRVTTNSTGTTPAITVAVSGPGVLVPSQT